VVDRLGDVPALVAGRRVPHVRASVADGRVARVAVELRRPIAVPLAARFVGAGRLRRPTRSRAARSTRPVRSVRWKPGNGD